MVGLGPSDLQLPGLHVKGGDIFLRDLQISDLMMWGAADACAVCAGGHASEASDRWMP